MAATATQPQIDERLAEELTSQPATETYRERKPCNLCGSEYRGILYHWPAGFYPHENYDTESWDGRKLIDLQIVQCRDCGLVYSCPSYRESALDTVYPEDVTGLDQKRAPGELLNPGKWPAMISCVRRHTPTGRVVCDIGTRYGALVQALRHEGYHALGIEYNSACVDLAAKLGVKNVFQGTVSDLPRICDQQGIESLDCVLMDDVLEHLVDPKRDLQVLGSLQKEGDILVLRQMDYDSWGRKLYGRHWYYFQPAAHMYYFSEFTLGRLLNRVGYGIQEVHRPPWPRHLGDFAKANLRWLLIRTPLVRRWFLRLRHNVGCGRRKAHYLVRRCHLEDMFMVVASKRTS